MNTSAKQHPIPAGFSLAGIHCGLKRSGKRDLTLVFCDRPATAAGVYTQNLVYAAPVKFDRQRTPTNNTRVVVINSGNANACTGQRGWQDAQRMASLAAEACNVEANQALVMSTGIIGEFLPMETIADGIQQASQELGNRTESLQAAAEGILTTDKGVKIASRHLNTDAGSASILGIAKGAGMIAPNMATMLGLILTDAQMSPEVADAMLRCVCDYSFNATSVDGHTSTNDTTLLLASGASGVDVSDHQDAFQALLQEVCNELAMAIADDGEGATHLMEIEVTGARNDGDAKQIARAVANSPLVKTAVTGADPNWGRIVSAAGCAGPQFDPAGMKLRLNGVEIFAAGEPLPFDVAALSQSIADNRCTSIQLSLAEADGRAIVWASNLTHDYITINAEYHT